MKMVGPVRVRAGGDVDRGVGKEVAYDRTRTRPGSRPVVGWSGLMAYNSVACEPSHNFDE